MIDRFLIIWIVAGLLLFVLGFALLISGEPLAWLSIAIGFVLLESSFRKHRRMRKD